MQDIKEEKSIILASEDAELIRSIFSDNDELLVSIRAVMLGVDVTEEDKELVKNTFANEKLLKIFKQRFLPKLTRNTPIGTISDDWVNVTSMVFGQTRDTINQAISYKKYALAMTEKALALLENPDGEQVDISYNPEADDSLGINLLSRNQFIKHIDSQLLAIKLIADNKAKSNEEKGKDSSR